MFGVLTYHIFGILQSGTVPAVYYGGITMIFVTEVKPTAAVFISYGITTLIVSYILLIFAKVIYDICYILLPKFIKYTFSKIDGGVEAVAHKLDWYYVKTLYFELLLGIAFLLLNLLVILLVLN
jgi:hypothetical protein